MDSCKHFIAVARPGADSMLANYPKIVLSAPDMESARERLPSYLRGHYAVHPMSPRAARQIEASMRPNARCP